MNGTQPSNSYSRLEAEKPFCEWLRDLSEPTWSKTISHRFTTELADGSLSSDVFKTYLIQDYLFLDELIGLFANAINEAESIEQRRPLIEFLETLTSEENDYFERSFEALGISSESVEMTEYTEITASFVDHLARSGCLGGYEESLAALLPAEWIYEAWAGRVERKIEAGDIQRTNEHEFYHDEWITLHTNEDFRNFVAWLRDQMNRNGPNLSERRQLEIARIFSRTVHLERAFFDHVYAQNLEK